MLYLGVFRLKFEKSIAIFEIGSLEFAMFKDVLYLI